MFIYMWGGGGGGVGVGPSRSGCLQNGVRGVEPDANTFKAGFRFFAKSLITIHFRISHERRGNMLKNA